MSSLKGRKQVGEAFGAYQVNFETVYHMNGQQTVELRGDQASGTRATEYVKVAEQPELEQVTVVPLAQCFFRVTAR